MNGEHGANEPRTADHLRTTPAWERIDTYDGTYGVLLYAPGDIPFVGARVSYGWVGLVNGSEYDADDTPTHWMRLPGTPE